VVCVGVRRRVREATYRHTAYACADVYLYMLTKYNHARTHTLTHLEAARMWATMRWDMTALPKERKLAFDLGRERERKNVGCLC